MFNCWNVWFDGVLAGVCVLFRILVCLLDYLCVDNIYIIRVLVCEQAYSMAQNLDPKSDGRGVLQFKTGLMSVIKVSLKL